jgi:hypothetical protein
MTASRSVVPLTATYKTMSSLVSTPSLPSSSSSLLPVETSSSETKSITVALDYSFVPLSFTLPLDYAVLSTLLSPSSMHDSKSLGQDGNGERRTWIVKPHAMARGNVDNNHIPNCVRILTMYDT